MLTISIINESTAISDADVQAMIPAFSHQWNVDLPTVWSIQQATFAFVPKGQKPAQGSWWMVFLDNSDQAGALAYHDLTSEGLPISKVFVKTLQSDNSSVSVGATHELCEMAIDPYLYLAAQDAKGDFYAYEICDPCEDDKYGYKIGDILVTDFVTPNWFQPQKEDGSAVDFKGHATKSLAVLSGGYAQKNDGSGWTQITGELAAMSARAVPPVGSRRDRRLRGFSDWKRSAPAFAA